jgi:hypothetical protein
MLTVSYPSGHCFARFADEAEERWLLLGGVTVVHFTLGEGVVAEVKQRDRAPPLFSIHFTGSKIYTFNPAGFRCHGVFSALKLPDRVDSEYSEWLISRGKRDGEIATAKVLAIKYGISLSSEALVPILLPILLKIESSFELQSTEIAWMEEEGLYRPLATYYYRQFSKGDDLWELAKACKYLRKALLPSKAIEISERRLHEESRRPAAAFAALLTSRGGAFRDIGDVESGLIAGERAVQLAPQSPHAHNLLGALYLTKGNISEGEQHFDIAASIGGNQKLRDSEYRAILASSISEEVRTKIAKYLLAKNPKDYYWAFSFIPRTKT